MTRADRGAASLLVVACLALLLLIGAAVGVVAAMVRAERVAQSAADLAALAGAVAQQRGSPACAAAREVAAANGATVESCVEREGDVLLVVRVVGPHWLGQTADLTATARAGRG